MSITTTSAAITGLQIARNFTKSVPGSSAAGRVFTTWGLSGNPGAGSWNSTLNGGTYSSSSAQVTGQIPHYDPASGNAYLARFSAAIANTGILLLCDRLWDNGGITITSTSAQTIASPAWPARDNAASTNGAGILLACEVSATVGSGTPTITVGYTNSAGTSGRTATNMDATVASPVAASCFRLGLQAGDIGVQSVQSITLSATWTSGTINLVAYRVLASLEFPAIQSSNVIDALTGGFTQLYNGTVPYLMWVAGGSNIGWYVEGTYIETQG